MATARDITVDTETGTVEVDLTITDTDLADYLADADPEEQVERAERAFRVGAMTLQLAETSKDLEYVKREFERMQGDIEDDLSDVHEEIQEHFGDDGELASLLDDHLGDDGKISDHLDEAFSEDGLFAERLEDELGEDGEKIQSALDPDVEGTPTYRLKSQLSGEIESLREKVVEERTREEEQRQSWKKGDDFEEKVAKMLDEVVRRTTHEVEHTGEKTGDLGREVGDHVLTLAETGQQIVFESKSDKSYNERKIKDEMADAIENRGADYGIFVNECESYIPDKIGYFQEWDNQILAVSLSHDEDDGIDPGFLRIAFNWARMRALQDHVDTGDSIDQEMVRAKVENVRDSIGRVSEAKTKCSDIQTTAEQIKKFLDDIRDDVTSDLDNINAELSKAGET